MFFVTKKLLQNRQKIVIFLASFLCQKAGKSNDR